MAIRGSPDKILTSQNFAITIGNNNHQKSTMKISVTFRMSLSNRRAIDDVAAHGRLTRGEAIDDVVESTCVNDLTDALLNRYMQNKQVESVNRSGICVSILPITVNRLDDLSIRTGLPRETVLRLAIEAYYVKFLSGKVI